MEYFQTENDDTDIGVISMKKISNYYSKNYS